MSQETDVIEPFIFSRDLRPVEPVASTGHGRGKPPFTSEKIGVSMGARREAREGVQSQRRAAGL